jgi:hypothetical protein
MSGQRCLLVERDIGAPIFTSAYSLVRLAYFHANRLLTGLYKTEKEIRWRKDDGNIKKQTDNDRHGLKPGISSQCYPAQIILSSIFTVLLFVFKLFSVSVVVAQIYVFLFQE